MLVYMTLILQTVYLKTLFIALHFSNDFWNIFLNTLHFHIEYRTICYIGGISRQRWVVMAKIPVLRIASDHAIQYPRP